MLTSVDIAFYNSLPKNKRDDWLFEREACDASLYYFICQMGAFSKDAGGDIYTAPYLWKPICKFWQDDSIKRKCVYMGRKEFKSTCLTRWGNLWRYLQDNSTRILLPSQKIELPQSFIRTIKLWAQTNTRLRYLYPVLRLIDKKWKFEHSFGATDCELPGHLGQPEPTLRAIGITGGAQGGHYPYISPDDIVNEKARDSKLVLAQAQMWFDNIEELTTDFDTSKKSGSVISCTGTHWGPADMGCYIQEKYPQYKWMIAPALKDDSLKDTENIKWIQNPEVGNGQSNWEWNTSTKTYLDMKANPEKSLVFWSQHQNNPNKADEFTRFSIEWLKYFRFEERDGTKFVVCKDDNESYRLKDIPIYGIVDPGGFADKITAKGGSRFAILLGGQVPGSHKKFVVFTWAKKMKEPTEVYDALFKSQEEFKPRYYQQETFGQQSWILKDFRSEATKRHSPLKILELDSDERKDAKAINIEALATLMFNGELYIHETMTDLIGEIKQYPGGLTKDLLDCLGKLNQHHWKRGTRPEASTHVPIGDVMHLAEPTNRTGY